MNYTKEQLEAIALKLRQMPPIEPKKQQLTKQEAVRLLSKEIKALQKRGYTLDQISETLKGEGLSIATPTLKSYLQRAKPVKKAATEATGQAVSSASPASSAKSPGNARKATFTPKPDSDDI